MNPVTASTWLAAWERGVSAPPLRRPVVLLEAWHPAEARPAEWAMGRREAALLELRAALFGGGMESLATCPQCGAAVEFTLSPEEMLAAAPEVEPQRVTVTAAGASVGFRLPNTRDLEAAAMVPAPQRERFILRRCLEETSPAAEEWPEDLTAAAGRAMAEADPLGDVSLHLTCSECGHPWEAPFDAGEYLWAELHSWATRLMSEIHVLAAAYGWTERDILAVPPQRRRFYLERARQS